ncbi:lanthionine synthetase C family protein [Streptosporangium sp. NPDC002544]|uniref:lanthionine synthetase C family protein n=1 Tax=Streptosporangium sp. NPDC002544 TaxID=3154538 RepID=UPI003329A4CD
MSTLVESGHVTKALSEAARKTAELIARRLADPEVVRLAVARSEQTARYPFGWGGASLYSGHGSSALLFRQAARALPDDAEHWRDLAHEQVVTAVRSTHEEPLADAGMAAGTAGLALVLADAASDDPRYEAAARGLDRKLADQVLTAASWRRAGGAGGVADHDYDVIVGATGSLTRMADADSAEPVAAEAVRRLIDDLLWLCDGTGERRPWFIPPEFFPAEDYHEAYPHGYVNLGLAHGIPGPLAALALARRAGHGGEPVRTTIRQVADYLVDAAIADEHGPSWAMGIPLDASGAEHRHGLAPARVAWCYGTPGVACALLHAADALDDHALRRFASSALEGVLHRFAGEGHFSSATLCHGAAGLLAICARFARDTDSAVARRTLPVLTEAVLEHCDPDLPLGVQDLEQPGVLLDSPGLLTGAAGVALALWSVSVSASTRWERALLIS